MRQHALGTAVIGGMLSGTVLAIFFVPLFFVLVVGLFNQRKPAAPGAAAPMTNRPRPLRKVSDMSRFTWLPWRSPPSLPAAA